MAWHSSTILELWTPFFIVLKNKNPKELTLGLSIDVFVESFTLLLVIIFFITNFLSQVLKF